MEIPTKKSPNVEIIEKEKSSVDVESKVILFNDEWHTFEEVISQVIKAINCNFETARNITFEVHVKGKALVFTGQLTACLKVSGVLEEIALHTQVLT